MISENFWSLKIGEIINAIILVLTAVAIVLGPRFAVNWSHQAEEQREARKRKLAVVANLMRTRGMFVHPDHVGALNLLQLEFYENSEIIRRYKLYLSNLEEPLPAAGNDLGNFLRRRRELFFDLLHDMTKAVNCPIDRYELERLPYLPTGWEVDDQENRTFRRGIIELLEGKRALMTMSVTNAPNNKFPPPP